MRAATTVTIIVGLLGCGQRDVDVPPGPRYKSNEDHFSTAALAGWTPIRELGSVVFTTQAVGAGQNTIAIRSVARDGEWKESRTRSLVLDATRRVIGGLPEVSVRREMAVDIGPLDGLAFELEFTPATKQSRYERRHVVLVGDERIFHVIHTAPKGRLAETAESFEKIVNAIREEG